jgi:hypothetical protein
MTTISSEESNANTLSSNPIKKSKGIIGKFYYSLLIFFSSWYIIHFFSYFFTHDDGDSDPLAFWILYICFVALFLGFFGLLLKNKRVITNKNFKYYKIVFRILFSGFYLLILCLGLLFISGVSAIY